MSDTDASGGAPSDVDPAESEKKPARQMEPSDVSRSLFVGDSEMATRMGEFDWASSPLGPAAEWPQGLRAAVRILLTSRFAMWMAWGAELTVFYNDAYARDTLRSKHPWALGRPADQVWAEIWEDIGPRIASVLATGEATWDEELLLFLERAGYPEETYHTFSYSPLFDDDAAVVGMLCVVREDTERVLAARRLRVLRELGDISAVSAPTAEVACADSIEVLSVAREDVPFASIYLLAPTRPEASRTAFFGVVDDPAIVPPVIDRAVHHDHPLWEVIDAGHTVVLEELDGYAELFRPVDGPTGPLTPQSAVAVPLGRPGGGAPLGVLFAGVSPTRRLDAEYHRFIELVAGQLSAAIADAQSLQDQRRRAEDLAELDRAKTEFFTGVSHELRTPLTLIAGPVDDALSDTTAVLPAEQRARLELAARNTGRLRRLVDTLLEFSQLEAGRLAPQRVPVDLSALTRGVAESFAPAIHRAGLRFLVECPPLGTAVALDVDMWEKIVLNLLSNALKYTLAGQITITLSSGPDPAAGPVRLVVADTGIGIAAAEQPRLFERFHRVRDATGRSHEGSGIGLALVAELVDLHHGTVTVDSAPGQGARFTVELPAAARSDEPPIAWDGGTASELYRDEASQWGDGVDPDRPGAWTGAGPDDERGGAPGQNSSTGAVHDDPGSSAAPGVVLVVEDNADLRTFISGILSPHYRVLLAGDGQQALHLARQRNPDLVLTDVMMPKLDGFGLLAALRAHPVTASIPVIVLSARTGQRAISGGLDAGADDYLVKPFSSADLLARVRATIAMARLRSREGSWRAALMNALSDGLFVLNERGDVIEINQGFTDILGYGPEALPYHPPLPWLPASDADRVLVDSDRGGPNADAALASGGGRGRWTSRWRHRDGRSVHVEVSTDVVVDRGDRGDAHGENGRVVGIVRDVSDAHLTAERARRLHAASTALAGAGTVTEIAAVVAGALIDGLGAHAIVVYNLRPDDLMTLRLEHVMGFPPDFATRFGSIDIRESYAICQATRRGRPIWPEDHAELPRHRRLIDAGTVGKTVAVLPLRIGSRALGAIALSYLDSRQLPGPDREFAATLVAHAAQAFARALHTDARWRIAETLQKALLPAVPAAHDYLALATRYLPAVHDLAAGGDWYDVICLDAQRTALVVGDVVGHGAEAAAVMGQLRSALAAMLQRGDTPAQALQHLNTFAAGIPAAWGSSAVCVLIDMNAGTLCYACAGHPPPVLVRPVPASGSKRGRAVLLEGPRGPILGVSGRPDLFPDADVEIEPGSTLVLYTDGLIERRGESLDDGLDRLMSSAEALADQPPDRLLARLLPAVGVHSDNYDDVAVVAARLLPPRLHQQLSAVPESIRELRRKVARWARQAALSAEHLYDLQLVLGEAASNAVEHAYPPAAAKTEPWEPPGSRRKFEYTVDHRTDGAVEVTVRDFGCWRPPASDPGWRGRGLPLIHGLARDVHVEPSAAGTSLTATVPAGDQPNPDPQPPTAARASEAGHDEGRPATVRTTADGGIEIRGDLDLIGVPAVRDRVASFLTDRASHAESGRDLVLDLGGLHYVSSAGVRLLLELADAAHTLDLRLRIRYRADGFLGRILSITGLATHPALTADPDPGSDTRGAEGEAPP